MTLARTQNSEQPTNGRIRGTVKWFSNAKGFGFIEVPGRKDVFVHHTGITGEGYHSLTEGQEVEFEIVNGAKGPQAQQLTVL